MFFLSPVVPPQMPPLGSLTAAPPFSFGSPVKEMSVMPFSTNESASAAAPAAPPSYEAVVLDPKGPRSQTNLFVRKLASAVTEEDMRKLFDRYGKIISFALMRDIHTGESLGTAFVRYSTHDEASAAMEALDGRELYGRQISIQWAKREHDSTPCGDARRKIRKLFVRNIPLDVTARQLRQIFSKFGSISNVTLHSDTAPAAGRDGAENWHPAQRMRNIAFILFQDDDVAEQAVSALHNTCPFESCEGIPLMVKLAEDNRDRIDRKQRFCESNAASVNTSMFSAAMIQGGQFSAAPSLSPVVVPLSTPASSTLSPPTLPMDVSANSCVFMRDGCMSSISPNGRQNLPFSVAAPTSASSPILHTTVDANGEAAYVYVSPSPGQGGEQHLLPPPSTPGPYMIAPSGNQRFPAAKMLSAQESQTFYRAPVSPSVPQYYQTVTLPQVFVDSQGQLLQQQSSMFLPGYYPSFSPNQSSLLHSQSQLQSQQVPFFDMQSVPAAHSLRHTPNDGAQRQTPQQFQFATPQCPVAISPQLDSISGAPHTSQTVIFSATDSPLNNEIITSTAHHGTDTSACALPRHRSANEDAPTASLTGEATTFSFASRMSENDQGI